MFLPIAFYNNSFEKIERISISPTDLGLQRGYSVFDFFKLRNFKNPWIAWYLERLRNSTNLVGLEIPYSNDQILEFSHRLFELNNIQTGYIKIIISAGNSNNGFNIIAPPSVLILCLPSIDRNEELYLNGARLISSEYERDFPNIKTTNYLLSAKMANDLSNANAVDVLFKKNDVISEASRCNFFVIEKNVIKTPKDDILKGITRRRIFSLFDRSNQLVETPIHYSKLSNISEAFISSTTKGVMPIVSIDDIKIGNGQVGKITSILMEKINSF